MPTSGRQKDLGAAGMRSAQGRDVSGWNLKVLVKQSAVNVNGDQPDGRIH